MRIIDSTRVSMGWDNPFQTRRASQINAIAVHFSATATGSRAIFENHWRNVRGWRNGGYSEIINLDGSVEICYVPEVVTNGVAGHNARAYNIAYVGAGTPSAVQLASLEARIRFNMNRFGIPASAVLAHREFSGQNTGCNPMDMDALRRRLANPPQAQNTAPHVWRAGDFSRDVTVTADVLNVRASRNASSALIGTLRRGAVVRVGWVLGVDNANPIPANGAAWGGVSVGGRQGFINLNFVRVN